MNKEFSIFATLSVPKLENKIFYSISSTYFTNDEKIPSLNNLINNLKNFDLIYILVVIENHVDGAIYPVIKTYDNLMIIKLSYNYFFDMEVFHTFYFKFWIKHRKKNIIFMFKDTEWFKIVYFFRVQNLVVSGGSPNRRHILSPTQSSLAIFQLALEGNKYIDRLNDSFYFTPERKQVVTSRYDKKNLKNKIDEAIVESKKPLGFNPVQPIEQEIDKLKITQPIFDWKDKDNLEFIQSENIKTEKAIKKKTLEHINTKRLIIQLLKNIDF